MATAPYRLDLTADEINSRLQLIPSLAQKSEIIKDTSKLNNDAGFITEETDPTVPDWAKTENKPEYTATEITYDNIESGLDAITVQDAINEVITEKQDKLTGIKGWQVVGFDVDGNAVAQDAIGIAGTITGAEVFNDYDNNIADGQYSHAEGFKTTASGGYSHAEGRNTTASGSYSHAEGRYTTASEYASHAEGYGTTASYDFSHAEGYGTTASGYASHAEGENTTAYGDDSHAEGYGVTANSQSQHVQGQYNILDIERASGRGTYAHIVGNGVSEDTRSNAHTLDWDGNAWFSGDVYVGSTSGTNKDEGSVKLATIDDIIENSIGKPGTATGAEVFNDLNTASGQYSHAEGRSTTASGNYSHAEGCSTTASTVHTHAEGYNSKASGYAAHAEGDYTTASGSASHAEGSWTKASGGYSHAEGDHATAYGTNSHAEGLYTQADGDESHAEGNWTTASGSGAHAEGNKTEAIGMYSHAEGSRTIASGYTSHAEGYETEAIGSYTHSEGYGTKATTRSLNTIGEYNIYEDVETRIVETTENKSGYISSYMYYYVYAFSESDYTVSNDGLSFIIENSSKILFQNLKSDDYFTTASDVNQTIIYKCNSISCGSTGSSLLYDINYTKYSIESNTTRRGQYVHIVGNGESEEACSNAHTLDWSGNAWFAGDVYVGSTSGTNKDSGSVKLVTESELEEAIDSIQVANIPDIVYIGDTQPTDENTEIWINTAEDWNDNIQSNVVLYEAQTLTNAQKAQARTNIGAASVEDINQLNNEKADKTYVDAEIAKLGQLTPEFVDSIEECVDTTKTYVLPDGYIYAYKTITTEGSTELVTEQVTEGFLNGQRLSTSSGEPKAQTNYVTTPLIDITGYQNWKIRLTGMKWTNSDDGSTISDGYAFALWNNGEKVMADYTDYKPSSYDSYFPVNNFKINIISRTEVEITPYDPAAPLAYTHVRFSGQGTADTAIVEIIHEVTTEGGTETKWVNTGLAFVPADNEDRIIALEADNAVLKSDNSALKTRVKALEDAAIYGNSIPAYVATEAEEVADKVLAVRTADSFVMGLASDLHTNGTDNSSVGVLHAGQGMDIISSLTQLDLVALLGDYEVYRFNYGDGDTDGEDARVSFKHAKKAFSSVAKRVPFMMLQGNHDELPADTTEEARQKYYAYIGANNVGTVTDYANKFRNYGYRDFDNYKIRVVYLNSTDVSEGGGAEGCYVSAEQLNWLNTVALNKTDGDWGIIVLTHHPLNWDGMSGLLSALDTYKGKNSGAELIAHFHGHLHNFRVETMGSNGVLSVTIPNACFSRNNEYGTYDGYSDTVKANFGDTDSNGNQRQFNKTANSANDTAFNVVVVDRAGRKIHAFNYGAGIDRELSY